MALWFLRHGESEANALGLFAGRRVDSPLTHRGRLQARRAAEGLPRDLDWIVSSPLQRARATAEIVRDELGLDLAIEVDDRVSDWDMGLVSGPPLRDLDRAEMVASCGAEDLGRFAHRVNQALDELVERQGCGLLVAHAGTADIVLDRLAVPGQTPPVAPTTMANAAILRIS